MLGSGQVKRSHTATQYNPDMPQSSGRVPVPADGDAGRLGNTAVPALPRPALAQNPHKEAPLKPKVNSPLATFVNVVAHNPYGRKGRGTLLSSNCESSY
jgi:hypothetical protein